MFILPLFVGDTVKCLREAGNIKKSFSRLHNHNVSITEKFETYDQVTRKLDLGALELQLI